MIYDVNSPQFQQFLRTAGRRRDDFKAKGPKGPAGHQIAHKPGGAASTGL